MLTTREIELSDKRRKIQTKPYVLLNIRVKWFRASVSTLYWYLTAYGTYATAV